MDPVYEHASKKWSRGSRGAGADLHGEVVAGMAASVDDVEGWHRQHLHVAPNVMIILSLHGVCMSILNLSIMLGTCKLMHR